MTPGELALICAPFVVIIFGFIGKVLFFDFRTLKDRVEKEEKEKIQITVELKDAISDVNDIKNEVKAIGSQQIRHDERIRGHDESFEKFEDRFDRIDDKLDMLLNKK